MTTGFTVSSDTTSRDSIAGVRFADAGPISYCSPGPLRLGTGDYIVVRTDRGERMGWVVLAPDQVLHVPEGPVRVIDRLASEHDVEAYRAMQARATEDTGRVQAVASRRDQRVRIASLKYDLDGKYADVTFVSREQDEGEWLRRGIARELNADVSVEQVGDRDRAKELGGLGQCGRALCCSTWQVEFPAISIKMAKDQGLAPNPSKISGVCGRLLCCLSFEIDAYREILGTLPEVGKRISTPVGRAKVLSINAISEIVRMRIDDTGEVVEMPAAALRAQYGTAVRPVDLEETVETPLHAQDRDRRDNFLSILQPVDMPTAPRRPEPPTERPTREDAPGERPARGQRRDRPAGEGTTARPPRERTDRGPRPERSAGANGRPVRTSRPGVAGRRSGRPAGEETPRDEPRSDAPRSEMPRADRPPRPAPKSGPPAGDATEGDAKRRRRRGRRGGRGRGSEGGAPESGSPAAE